MCDFAFLQTRFCRALRSILAHSTCSCKSKTKQKSFYQSYLAFLKFLHSFSVRILMCLKILHKEFYEIGQIFAIFEDSISKKKYNEIERNFFSLRFCNESYTYFS